MNSLASCRLVANNHLSSNKNKTVQIIFRFVQVNCSRPFQKKCEQYWPNEGTVTYGSVTIASKELIDYGSFTKRLLEVTNRDFPDEVCQIFLVRFNNFLFKPGVHNLRPYGPRPHAASNYFGRAH